jgi:hypothetical protein
MDFSVQAQEQRYFPATFQLAFGVPLSSATLSGMGVANGNNYSTSSTMQGSLDFGSFPLDITFAPSATVSTAAVLIRPYLDINGNGKRDPGEEIVTNIDIESDAGIQERRNDGSIQINYLPTYQVQKFICRADRVEEPTWKPRFERFSLTLKPDQTQIIDIPISPVSEINGLVVYDTANGSSERRPVSLVIKDSTGSICGTMTTDEDGGFYYSGLLPGKYSINLSSRAIDKNGMRLSEPVSFYVKPERLGQSIEGIRLVLKEP